MIPENTLTKEAKNELNKITEIEKWYTEKNQFIEQTNIHIVFNFRTINTIARDIYNGTISLKEGDKDQSSLLVEIINFKSNIKPQN